MRERHRIGRQNARRNAAIKGTYAAYQHRFREIGVEGKNNASWWTREELAVLVQPLTAREIAFILDRSLPAVEQKIESIQRILAFKEGTLDMTTCSPRVTRDIARWQDKTISRQEANDSLSWFINHHDLKLAAFRGRDEHGSIRPTIFKELPVGEERVVRIKTVDFKVAARVNSSFEGTSGLSWVGDDQIPLIQMDIDIPAITRYGRRWMLFHELTHVKVRDLKIKMGHWAEELYCDYEGLVRTKDVDLHVNERALKRLFVKGRDWRRAGGRQPIIQDILAFINVKLSAEDVEKLVFYKERKHVIIP